MALKEGAPPRSIASLPHPDNRAYFPNKIPEVILTNEILQRAGKDNLIYALEYGSQVGGDASRNSMHDIIVIVQDVKKFHRENLKLHKGDYAQPHLASFHSFLNQFGFNFYLTHARGENGQVVPLKMAVISREDFIKGCNNVLPEKDAERKKAFGLYIAGRVQKAALVPLYKLENDESSAAIESAINTARIDGVWLALGLLKKQFSFDELLQMYVSLSYKADVRVEKPDKVKMLIENNRSDYEEMMEPIIQGFIENGLIKQNGELFEKITSLSEKEVNKRLIEFKIITFLTNYLKNPLTSGITQGIVYALKKIARVADHCIKTQLKSKNTTKLH